MTAIQTNARAARSLVDSSLDAGANRQRDTKQVAAYAGPRLDIVQNVHNPGRVLDVGCNEGALARELRNRSADCRVWGIDINPTALACAEDALEAGYCINLDQPRQVRQSLDGLSFDTIIAADVLEHTVDPWKALETLLEYLAPHGQVLISLPNFGHWETMWHMLRQRFPRRSRGLYDDTHLRFFMKANLDELEISGFDVSIVQRNFRLWERRQTPIDRMVACSVGLIPWFREYFVFQYLIRLERQS